MFGNPGSTELPMLADFPSDFRYVLGLQEAVVVGMADGYAQATGRVAHVNLHTAPGVGNAVGALFNAWANKAPLLVTAGQQVRAHMTMQANLTNRDAVVVPQPFVKWAYEPPRAADVPAALARAIHTAVAAAARAGVRLDPDGRLGRGVRARSRRATRDRRRGVPRRARAGRARSTRRAARARRRARTSTPAAPGTRPSRSPSGRACSVWATPAPGGGRLGFPESHPQFRGVLAPAIGPAGQMLAEHDLVIVAGSSVFPYYPYMPGPALPEGTRARRASPPTPTRRRARPRATRSSPTSA